MKTKHLIILLLTVMIYSNCFSQWEKYFVDKTLRVDYSHSGHVGVDYFTINQLKELDFYAGNHNFLIDKTNNGAYMVALIDKNTDEIIFSKGVSSLYNEWLSTKEAQTTCGNFQEVVLLPMPKNNIEVQIAFYVRDSVNKFKQVQRFDLDYSQITPIDTKPSPTIVLNSTNRSMDKRVDLTLIPIGYTIEEKDKMFKDLKTMSDYMFSEQPYKNKKDRIQITAVERYSQRSGVVGLKGRENEHGDLGVTYNTFSSPRYIMTQDLWDLYDVINTVPTDAIILVCNSSVYGGGGIYNYYATCYMGEKSREVIVHEFSHSFVGLGDEYSDNDSDAGQTSVLLEPYEKNITTLVDFSNKWADKIDKQTPIPTPNTKQYENKVGVFEGAAYMSKGFYRPFQHCMMRDLKEFCPVCTDAINEIIDLHCN